MRIALDAMGTDECPVADVAGGVLAARELGYTVILVGDKSQIEMELSKTDTNDLNLEVIHAAEAITMTDKPSVVGKGKPKSSMHIGTNLVRDGEADAFVTMGNTGAAHAIATLYTLKRIPGVRRPAISGIYPLGGKHIILLDLGANADSKPDWLAQFAVMGKLYAQNTLGLVDPRIALLSNGEEEGKGNQLIKDAAALLLEIPSIHFIGNVEPKDVMRGHADVIVADGFVGNIFVKTFEATSSFLSTVIREELGRNPVSIAGGLLARPAFGRVRQRTDTSEIGGAPLLGVNGVVIIGHGRSNAMAIKNAVRQAGLAVKGRIIEAIRDGLQQVPIIGTTD
jgi:glycerol-3-phosphate acyltransferase PlsX